MDPRPVPVSTYNEDERNFLQTEAENLLNSNQSCELHTRTQGSIYRGTVLHADPGGIVFQKEDGSRVVVPISLVEKFVGIPQSWGQQQNAQQGGRAKAAGANY